jgi:predicted PurR-regulated permease PerM
VKLPSEEVVGAERDGQRELAASVPNGKAAHLYRFVFVLLLTIAVAATYLLVIRQFVIDTVLGAIFAGLLFPVYEKSTRIFGGRRGTAAGVVVTAALLAAALPLALIAAVVVTEALQSSAAAAAWIRQTAANPEGLFALLPKSLVENAWFRTAAESVSTHVADIVNSAALFLSRQISAAAFGAIGFVLHVFVIAFAVFTFLQHGQAVVQRLLEYIPVARGEAAAIVRRTLQITSATLKSIVIIGGVQGALVGIGFAFTGLGQPWFWGTVAAGASVVPALGSGLVWTPGAIYLMLTGHVVAGVVLLLWGALVVASADNVLRLFIVGRGAQLPGFVVLVSTLGGIGTLGPSGVLIGPVLAGLLFGVLDLYHAVQKSSGLSNSAD